jgi:hypothetical protein
MPLVHACRSMHAGSCMQHSMQHACNMHAGSCIHVHVCRSMHAGSCQLLLMRACARCAYCKKCRVNLGSKRSRTKLQSYWALGISLLEVFLGETLLEKKSLEKASALPSKVSYDYFLILYNVASSFSDHLFLSEPIFLQTRGSQAIPTQIQTPEVYWINTSQCPR